MLLQISHWIWLLFWHTHTYHVLHKTVLKECSVIFSLSSYRDFIHNILCTRPKGFIFYQNACLDGTFPKCSGMKLLRKCIHVSDEHELGRKLVSLKNLKYVAYDIDGGQERKNIQLVTSQVWLCDFIKGFVENTQHYVPHVHVAQW